MRWRLLLCLLALTACMSAPPGASTGPARILVIGDSLMAWNRLRGASVAKALSAQLGEPVRDNSVSGAVHDLGGKPAAQGSHATIARQYRSGNWDWVVMDGGGNNLLFGCGCSDCGPQLDALISADATQGAIPRLVAQIRADGAQVIHTGYLRSPGFTSPIEHCGPIGDELDRRLARLDARDPGMVFLRLSDLVPTPGDTSYHALDRIHPSAKGSAAIAARIAAMIRP
ncbi:SGNH/GDSL hydrolase family protein [uncultured Paracoccus sp.]|uniref:SGNH/GDSL hydrolase family protein n=1 Tax=uncultured Paracoccus sp. TaxID=189685 RepID=UPI0026299199|nr:SGNH/GDSL hydrolase family protein [uncultured Paracoccus sp.]